MGMNDEARERLESLKQMLETGQGTSGNLRSILDEGLELIDEIGTVPEPGSAAQTDMTAVLASLDDADTALAGAITNVQAYITRLS